MSRLQTRISALDDRGYACIPSLLGARDCVALTRRYDAETGFRNWVIMARHGFGQGEYKYFGNPLPVPVDDLRAGLYPPLAAIANRWNESLRVDERFPPVHGA
jgi:hypothetical protein